MKSLFAFITLGVVLSVGPVYAAGDAPAKKKMVFNEKRSMDVDKGRYHILHKKQEELDCDDCHDKVQKDILYLRKDDPYPPGMDKVGQVDRKGCLTCHRPGYKPNGPHSFWGV